MNISKKIIMIFAFCSAHSNFGMEQNSLVLLNELVNENYELKLMLGAANTNKKYLVLNRDREHKLHIDAFHYHMLLAKEQSQKVEILLKQLKQDKSPENLKDKLNLVEKNLSLVQSLLN